MANNLIIYFSRTGQNYVNGEVKTLEKGNTEIVAEYIRNAAGGDLFKLEPVQEYPVDYYQCIDLAKKEAQKKARPELKSYLKSVEDYDNIVVAGPCWWGTYPMAVFTQLEKLDWSGKKVFPVMTHEGSGQAGSVHALKQNCKGAVIGEGLAVHGADAKNSEAEVTGWATKNLV